MKRSIYLTLIFSMAVLTGMAQSYSLNNKASKVEVLGTSTLHDWEMTAEQVSGKANLEVSGSDVNIKALSIELKAETLKSGKSSMDKNAYEALKTDDHPTIKYAFKSVSSTSGNKLTTTGTLTLAGVSKTITMPVTATVSGNTVTFKGKYTFKMSSFKIDPPTALMGTVKTGDEITVEFNAQYTK
ncbi:YceI family protein [Fulvivirga sediminis]|uniref:YceI family protein n=1 Tax=Fulvivirga sediminis TaxID=2803949 RepID=A0A937F8D7_9BACT|nr:YceI family protein [Fulvivirga sediminis]MBL3655933.1 YceI family protein [Fulvivirga sediminis]